ncbi:062cd18c-aebb-4a51-8804-0dac359fcb83 [Sclerotinia trifoliorum]|uniref:062cd18c-aebb-4a51-8804-0dac359fcb83 n=1 Tax=Sclerotinia trifoliorum TaxID=28548 RepID=A0A8H2VKT6_9HELO|nr:062cd18c-aebb-4a51-8804-0dac359fcb83 [Sclerotinia trifoliorum]
MASPSIKNVHFVGSICLPDTSTIFRTFNTTLPTQLKRIPDGEPGNRGNFVHWQRSVFYRYPYLVRSLYFSLAKDLGPIPISPEKIQLMPSGYDGAAINSYATFCRLRDDATIPMGVKFQVSLPTPINVLHVSIEPAFQEALEPVYTKAFLKTVRHIQEEIPTEDLAIQWDVAVEFAFLEGIVSPPPHVSTVDCLFHAPSSAGSVGANHLPFRPTGQVLTQCSSGSWPCKTVSSIAFFNWRML